jgi:hypothetical protein
MAEIEFLLARRQNAFFTELATILRDELRELGAESTISVGGGSTPRPGLVQVLMPPHEYETLAPGGLPRDRLGRMIFICAEPPGSPWFEGNVRLVPFAGAVFDINQASVEAFEGLGLEVRHLPLGYSRSWDRFDPGAERDVDVAFLGCATERRGRVLAGYAPTLARRRCELVISDNDHPNPVSGASFLAGEDKWSLLRRSRVLLNIHRERHPPYFEWVRVLEAIHCGAVVVSEASSHYAPLEPGRHFAAAPAEGLDRLVDELLDSPDRLDSLRRAAYEHVRSRLPMSDAAAMLAEAAETIAARPAEPPRRTVPRPRRPRGLRSAIGRLAGRRPGSTAATPLPPEPPSDPAPAEAEIHHRTPAWGGQRPVSVIVLGHDQRELVDGLESAVAERPESVELIVVDDRSDDGTAEAAEAWLDEHGSIPGLLLADPAGGGHVAGRNAAIAHARGALLLAMNPGDRLLPNGLDRLSGALAADPDAAFAYGIVQVLGDQGPDRLYNHFGWEPPRIANGDYIDAPALIRRSALEQVGGYRENLWFAFAERGLRGAHVRQFVASSRLAVGAEVLA